MTKLVRDTKAGKSISAWVVLDCDNNLVATVQAHYSDSGGVMIDIYSYNVESSHGPTLRGVQHGKASGYGYDKLTAALAGLEICGIRFMDHCETKDGNMVAGPGMADVDGANWSAEKDDWGSHYYKPGLERLVALGFRVIQAI